jgi:hypothetical protein
MQDFQVRFQGKCGHTLETTLQPIPRALKGKAEQRGLHPIGREYFFDSEMGVRSDGLVVCEEGRVDLTHSDGALYTSHSLYCTECGMFVGVQVKK